MEREWTNERAKCSAPEPILGRILWRTDINYDRNAGRKINVVDPRTNRQTVQTYESAQSSSAVRRVSASRKIRSGISVLINHSRRVYFLFPDGLKMSRANIINAFASPPHFSPSKSDQSPGRRPPYTIVSRACWRGTLARVIFKRLRGTFVVPVSLFVPRSLLRRTGRPNRWYGPDENRRFFRATGFG